MEMVFYFDFHTDRHHRGLITVKSFFLGNTKRYTPSNTVVTYFAVSSCIFTIQSICCRQVRGSD